MGKTIELMQQFLEDEKELLLDLAVDVANAIKHTEYLKAKAMYDAQQGRVKAIKDTLAFVK